MDWLLETQLSSIAVNGKSLLAFPLSVEAHPNMFLKTMLEAGVPLDYTFTHQKSVRGRSATSWRARTPCSGRAR